MLRHFHNTCKPAAEKFPGYIDLKMLKPRTAIKAPFLQESTGLTPLVIAY